MAKLRKPCGENDLNLKCQIVESGLRAMMKTDETDSEYALGIATGAELALKLFLFEFYEDTEDSPC